MLNEETKKRSTKMCWMKTGINSGSELEHLLLEESQYIFEWKFIYFLLILSYSDIQRLRN